jgi:UDP-N-acetyl-D-mannosaminuronic acid dehydrogenase
VKKIGIIGGCGHVGIPLGLALADRDFDVTLLDINAAAVHSINRCILPFKEAGAEEILRDRIGKNLIASTDTDMVKGQDVVVFVTGTPVDEHHNPKINDVLKVIRTYLELMNKKQLVILRSTIFPGTTELITQLLYDRFGSAKLAFCPERIVQGKGIEEIFNLPQIIASSSEEAYREAWSIFSKITPKIIRLAAKEAELVKLITNTWRYLEFAAANAFYMMVEQEGLDFYTVYNALKADYPRAEHFPSAGLAAGPCLFKDTMQLSAFYRNNFFLGQSAMLVNEGLPNFLVDQLEKKMGSLAHRKIAVLGMTFKPNNDDIRESLSFKIKKLLEFKMASVLVNDPYLEDSLPISKALEQAEGVILGTPHDEYKNITLSVPFVDCWGFWKRAKIVEE